MSTALSIATTPPGCPCRRCAVAGWVGRGRPRAQAIAQRRAADRCRAAADRAVDTAIGALGWNV